MLYKPDSKILCVGVCVKFSKHISTTGPGEPPEIITDPSPGGIDVVTIGNSACFNDSILINCSLRAGTRPVMYEWTRDGKAIPPPSPAHILHVNRPGNYSCMVMNSFGRDFASSVVRGKKDSQN